MTNLNQRLNAAIDACGLTTQTNTEATLVAIADAAIRQRDELVAALQNIVREFDCSRTPIAGDISAARAALAKVQ